MITHTLVLGGAEFDFQFSFTPDEPLPLPPSSPPAGELPVPPIVKNYVECLFFRKDFPDNYFHWSGNLTAGQIPFALPGGSPPPDSYPDNDNIRGNFWLYTNVDTGLSYVWFDLNYGPGYEGEFEGTMVQFPPSDKNP